MKYQSEIVKEIIDSRGHEKSSLHYQSECIETWIKESEGSYPKLCDYEGEWLNYINENPIGEFPYETLTDVTTATVNNVVPFEYKSAILSGNTLVNLMTNCKDEYVVKYNDINNPNNIVANISMMKPNTEYTLFYKAKYRTEGNGAGTSGFLKVATSIEQGFIGTAQKLTTEYEQYVYKITTSSVVDCFVFSTTDKYFAIKECVLLEGDYTQEDIPFFEGMQSVKMPVLTTTGKNLFDGELEIGGFDASTGKPNTSTDRVRSKNFIKVFNPLLTISRTISEGQLYVYEYDKNKTFIRLINASSPQQTIKNLQLSENAKYIKFADKSNNLTSLFQFEQGTQSTPYEPFKSNILTTSEEVELRGVGEVRDELNLLTGELTQHVGAITIDDSHSWRGNAGMNGEQETHLVFQSDYKFSDYKYVASNLNIASNKFSLVGFGGNAGKAGEWLTIGSNGLLYVKINKNKLDTHDINGFKKWLLQNPITIQYELTTKSVKTVDLTITNQDGETLSTIKPLEGTMNITTSGTPINPLFSGEIPVEAITQNLNSFIKE